MKLMRFIGTASVAGGLMLGMAGTAAADDVGLANTGPDSNQNVTVDNTTKVTTDNSNDVVVVNVNDQNSVTGGVKADSNTSVGGEIQSGNASNNNSQVTEVGIENSAPVEPGQGGSGGNTGGSGGNGGSSGGSGGSSPGQGSVLGASTGGMGAGTPEMLPVTGPMFPVDVSALRAAWHPQTSTAAAASSPARSTGPISMLMLVTAALLSLLGAFGSAVYARKVEGRV